MGKHSSSSSGIQMVDPNDLEKQTGTDLLSLYNNLQKRLNPATGEATQEQLNADQTSASNQYASLLQQLSQNGGVPSQADTNSANSYAQQAFQGQQTALNQSFQDQNMQMQRMAAQMGRSIGDPILRAKLAQEQIRQQSQLSANQGAFANQYAQNIGQQRLGGAEALMGLRQGLASQAIQNRMTLLNLGSQLQANERNFRVQTATRYNQGSEGGGLGGAISGGLAGIGMGMSAVNMVNKGGGFANFFGGGGGGTSPTNMGINDASGGLNFRGYT
jgi:hypothetical protein